MKINAKSRLVAFGFSDFRNKAGQYYYSPVGNTLTIPGHQFDLETREGFSSDTSFEVNWELVVVPNRKYGGYNIKYLVLENSEIEYREYFDITKPLVSLPAEIEDIAFRCKRLGKILSGSSLKTFELILGIKIDDKRLPRVYNDGWI